MDLGGGIDVVAGLKRRAVGTADRDGVVYRMLQHPLHSVCRFMTGSAKSALLLAPGSFGSAVRGDMRPWCWRRHRVAGPRIAPAAG
jgi:hypothetical protein